MSDEATEHFSKSLSIQSYSTVQFTAIAYFVNFDIERGRVAFRAYIKSAAYRFSAIQTLCTMVGSKNKEYVIEILNDSAIIDLLNKNELMTLKATLVSPQISWALTQEELNRIYLGSV